MSVATMVPADRRYSAQHIWCRADGDDLTLGLAAPALPWLGSCVRLELPEPGARLRRGQMFARLTGTRAMTELIAPLDGVVTAMNDRALASPGLVDADAYGAGWLVRVRGEVAEGLLLAAAQYEKTLGAQPPAPGICRQAGPVGGAQ